MCQSRKFPKIWDAMLRRRVSESNTRNAVFHIEWRFLDYG